MNDQAQIPAAAPNRRARIASFIACAIILLTPSLYSFRFTSFMDAKSVGLVVGGILLATFVSPDRVFLKSRFYRILPLLGLVVCAVVVSFARASETLDSSESKFYTPYIHAWLVSLIILGAATSRSIHVCIALSIVPVAAMALAQYAGLLPGMFPDFPEYGQRMYSVFGNQDLLGGYMALGLVLGLALWLDRAIPSYLAAIPFVFGFPTLLLSGSRSAWLAAFLGAALASWQHRNKLRQIGAMALASIAVLIAVVVMAPGATWGRFAGTFAQADTGYRIRLWIWDGTLHLISQYPVVGVGMGNFAFYSPRALGEVLHERGPGVHVFNHIHTQHAHSDLLEILAETGLIGAVLLAAFLVMIPRRRSPVWPALATAFTFSLVNTTLHSPPHVLAILLLAGSIVPAEISASPRQPRYWRLNAFLVACFAISGAAWMAVVLYPNALLARAQALYENKEPAAEETYDRASFLYGNHHAAVQLAILLANRGEEKQAIIMADHAARGLDTGELYYLRAYLTERLSQPGSAALYRECLLRWPDHAPAYAGLLRNTAPDEHEAILAEAKRWLSPEDYNTLTAPASTPTLP